MKNIILGKVGSYTIINRGTKYQSFICAYLYDEKTDTWMQGHYFSTFEEAVKYSLGGLALAANAVEVHELIEIATEAINYLDMMGELDDFKEEYDHQNKSFHFYLD